MFYLTVYILSICLLQFIFLFCFYEMLKQLKRIIFFSFQWYFLSDGIVLCLCCAQAVYYSSFTMLCIWPVGCVLRELYSQSALQMSKPPSELWYKCLVRHVLLFNDKKKAEKRSRPGGQRRSEEAGSEGRDWKAKTPPQLLNPPHLTTLLDF